MAVRSRIFTVAAVAILAAGCSTTGEHKPLNPLPWPNKPTAKATPAPKLPPAKSGKGGYYKDDGPGENIPDGLIDLPDAIVKDEPLHKWANRPYKVLGKNYTPIVHDKPFSQTGIATWYGVKFHGQRTSSGELYDMYKMTAAHPTLPIPSYARVTSLDTGHTVVVRINDRGPFHADRVIDVSYTAALKLGLLGKGSHKVVVERLFPGEQNVTTAAVRRQAASSAQSSAPEIASTTMRASVQSSSAAVARVDAIRGGYFVQFGAFSRIDSVDYLRDKLVRTGLDVGKLQVVQSGKLNRLYGGPFGTRAAADAAAAAVRERMGIKPIVVRR